MTASLKILLAFAALIGLAAVTVNGPSSGPRLQFSADNQHRNGDDLVLRGNVRIALVGSEKVVTADEAVITTHPDGSGQVLVRGEVRLAF